MKTIDVIKNYYKDNKLEVLDGGKTYGEFSTNHYAAVSLDYIHKYVLKEKVSKKFTARKIMQLCNEDYLLPIPCSYAGNLVFIRSNHHRTGFVKFTVLNNKVVFKKNVPNFYYTQKDKEWIKTFNSYL